MPSTFRDKLMFQSYFVLLSLCSSIWTLLKPRLPYGECQTIFQSPSLASRRQLKFTNVKNHVRLFIWLSAFLNFVYEYYTLLFVICQLPFLKKLIILDASQHAYIAWSILAESKRRFSKVIWDFASCILISLNLCATIANYNLSDLNINSYRVIVICARARKWQNI